MSDLSWTAALVNHLWQSTAVVVVAWLLAAALKKNHARVRYWVWFAASIKFLLPFSLLIVAGEWMRSLVSVPAAAQPVVASVMEQVTQPFGQAQFFDVGSAPIAAAHHASYWPLVLVAVWLCGALFLAIRFGLAWAKMNAVKRRARPFALAADVPVLSSSAPIEPGIFGVFRPVLLLPEGIPERLSAEQMRAIVAHEMCHVRRRDNLNFAIHMVVETLFWFHPMVWWIGSRLIEERERACDEAVVQAGSKAQVYAEGILNVCKFYVESPLACISGVTGADLKGRIMRIMAGQSVRKLGVKRKALLALACVLAVLIPVTSGVVHAAQGQTQPAGAAKKDGITGTWQGTLHAPGGHNLRTVLKVTKDDKGALHAMFYSLDQGGRPIPTSSVSFDNGTLKYGIEFFSLTYEGKMSADGNSISGTSTQGSHSLPLVFERATPATAWAIPAPPPRIPPMAADANPSFEVATIKPTKPDEKGNAFVVQGTSFKTINSTLMSLISISYGLQDEQIVNAPDWASSEHFDIDAKPDTPGIPNKKQLMTMVQKLLVSRFNLKFHKEKREMTAYVLTVGKDGPKMTKTNAGPNDLPGFRFGPIGTLHVFRANMDDLTEFLQSMVLDRPVVDETGLQGRWNFTLKWTPDESQFAQMGMKAPPPSADDANAAPPLFTAIQEQLGLKLQARKTPVDVMVIDHVDQPSPN